MEADLAGTRPRLIQRIALPAALAAALAMADAAAAQGLPGIAGPYLAAENAARRGDIAEAARLYAEALLRDSSNTRLMENTLNQQLAAGDLDRAIPVARRLDALTPGAHLGSLLLAAEAMRKGEPGKARVALVSGRDEVSSFAGKVFDAWATFEAGDTDGSREILESLQETTNDSGAGGIVSAYHLGLLEAAAGLDEAALPALERAAELAGRETPRMVRIRAGVLARLDRVDDARALIAEQLGKTLGDERLEALDADLAAGKIPAPLVRDGLQGAAEGLHNVSGFLSQSSNWLLSLAYARLAVYLDPELTEARLMIAGILRDREQYDLAIAAFAAIPDDAPEALDARIGRAGALFDSGQADAAVAVLRETAALYPRSIEAYTMLGDTLRRESRFAEASDAYDGAIALVESPERRHWVLYYQRGIALERSKQWDRAEADFRKALELEPEQALVLNYLGYSWVEMGLHLDEAQTMIEKAVEQRPQDGFIVDSLGWVLYRLGDFAGAVEHLERAVELQPVDPVINDHFGDALWMIGRRVEARFQWKRALSFEPEDDDAVRIRRKLAEGLDAVMAEEAAAGKPAIIGTGAGTSNGG
ncbi:MAG TPA: tetratricopeptide repeat protein [Thermohalobaculum sp.]|nr:tetratricopeptide repeat protein [Thermohalobaculum sp.]